MNEEPKKRSKVEIRHIPPLTVDGEDAYLVRQTKVAPDPRRPNVSVSAPWKRMTKQEILEEYPEAFDK
jgi:hypothetical protein